jgi:predicted HicB family RNase H-like nuclease
MARTVITKGGRTLTEADLDRLASSVEENLDISAWAPRRGRPSLSEAAGVHSPRIAVRVPEDLRRRAAARAASEGRSLSVVVRDLLEHYARDGASPSSPASKVRVTRS